MTRLLRSWSEGDELAGQLVMPMVYAELKSIARACLRRERAGHLLETSALVHEAYLRLCRQNRTRWRNRQHFLSVAAHAMRRILLNDARERTAMKRRGEHVQLEASPGALVASPANHVASEIRESLKLLRSVDPTRAAMLVLKYFDGYTLEEIARSLDVSRASVVRGLRLGRLWLREALKATRG